MTWWRENDWRRLGSIHGKNHLFRSVLLLFLFPCHTALHDVSLHNELNERLRCYHYWCVVWDHAVFSHFFLDWEKKYSRNLTLRSKFFDVPRKNLAGSGSSCYNPRTGKTPYECMTGIKPNLSNMHVFGSVCYAFVQNTTKLDPRAEKVIFVGYDRSSPAFLVYCPRAKTLRKVRCVKFTENFDNADETVELLPDSVKLGEPEIPTHGNEDANVRHYPARDHVRPKYLDDYVTGRHWWSNWWYCKLYNWFLLQISQCSPIIPRCNLIPRGQ